MSALSSPVVTHEGSWSRLTDWLISSDGDWLVDALAMGEAITYEIDETLEDFGIPANRDSRNRLAFIADAVLSGDFR